MMKGAAPGPTPVLLLERLRQRRMLLAAMLLGRCMKSHVGPMVRVALGGAEEPTECNGYATPAERMSGDPQSWFSGTASSSGALRPWAGTTRLSHALRRYSGVRFHTNDLFMSVPVRCRFTSHPAVACAKLVTLAIADRTQSFMRVCSSTLA